MWLAVRNTTDPKTSVAVPPYRQEYARGVHKERLRAAVTVTAATFSPCGNYVICASDSGRLAVWELAPYMDRAAFSPGES